MTLRFSQDWERIKELGLKSNVKTVEDYEDRVAEGLSLARDFMNLKGFTIPSLAEIKQLHRIAFRGVHPWAGELRPPGYEVSVGQIDCTPSTEVTSQLQELRQQVLSVLGPNVPVAKQIFWFSFYHAAFESIHPFTDGNGRIGRVILGAQVDNALKDGRRTIVNRAAYMNALRSVEKTSDPSPLAQLIVTSRTPAQELAIDRERGITLSF